MKYDYFAWHVWSDGDVINHNVSNISYGRIISPVTVWNGDVCRISTSGDVDYYDYGYIVGVDNSYGRRSLNTNNEDGAWYVFPDGDVYYSYCVYIGSYGLAGH